jgi:hypothetical protein
LYAALTARTAAATSGRTPGSGVIVRPRFARACARAAFPRSA